MPGGGGLGAVYYIFGIKATRFGSPEEDDHGDLGEGSTLGAKRPGGHRPVLGFQAAEVPASRVFRRVHGSQKSRPGVGGGLVLDLPE